MKITPVSLYNSIYFTSKNKNIRLADDVMRKSKLAFPYVGNTYINRFYRTVNNPNNSNARRLYHLIHARLSSYRYSIENEEDKLLAQRQYDDCAKDYFIPGFEKSRNADKETHQRHKGNCDEAARAALAALYANGFYNSNLANLYYKTSLVNKHTGEVEYEDEIDLDHVFVVTDMGSGDKNIVIDPWLSFADSESAAKGKYYQIYYDEEGLKEFELSFKKSFNANTKIWQLDRDINDYYQKSSFVFRTKPTHKKDVQKHEAGYQFRTLYPELLLNKIK